MARRIALFAAWLGATALAVIVASAAVGTVRTEVTDQPAAAEPFIATTIASAGTASTLTTVTATSPPVETSTTTTIIDATRDDDIGDALSSTDVSSTTIVETQGGPSDGDDSVPSTTVPKETTTTAPSATKTYKLVGGTVTISASNPDVRFVGASPAAGYSIEVEDLGPNQVKVECDGESGESKFVAKWDSGELLVDIDEE